MRAIELSKLQQVFDNTKGRVVYDLGAKAPSLTCDSSDISKIDCSGFVRYALAKASEQQTILPDGSANQREWCDTHNLHKLADYKDIAQTVNDNMRLFVGFKAVDGGHGHIWLIHRGATLESHGSHNGEFGGVTSRAWNDPVLLAVVDACYELLLNK